MRVTAGADTFKTFASADVDKQVALFASYVAGERATAEATVLAWGLGSVVLTNLGTLLVGMACLATPLGQSGLRAARSGANSVSASQVS